MKRSVIHYKLLLLFCTLFGGTISLVTGQYYHFDNAGIEYIQGCNSSLNIRINMESHPDGARAGLFRLVLDPLHFSYSTALTANILRTNLFIADTSTFADYTSNGSPSWQDAIPSILQIDRKNNLTSYKGNGGLYGRVQFSPLYNPIGYTGFFSMIFENGDTTKTSLSKVGGVNIINASHQYIYQTGLYYVYQKPCINDTVAPSNTIILPAGTTKQSHLSGIELTLTENSNAGTVPYVRTGGGVGVGIWTGNTWGTNNQYGVNVSTFQLWISGNGSTKFFTGGMFSSVGTLSRIANGTTWQFRNKNYTIDIDGSELFSYGIEKTITITGNVKDRNNNMSTFSKTFNNPIKPWIRGTVLPAGGDTLVSTTAAIQFGLADDRAGVDSGSITITLQGIGETIYGPYTFSGSDLYLSGILGNANQPDYDIRLINHPAFPSSGTIQVNIDAQDIAGNHSTISPYTFTTKPSCIDLGCCNPIYIQIGDTLPFVYNGTTLNVSGGNNPSFSIEGNTGILYCGIEEEGMTIYKGTEAMSGSSTYVDTIILDQLVFSGSNVKATLSGNTIYLEKINVVPIITGGCIGNDCGGGGGGGGGTTISKDNCMLPNSTLACANIEGTDDSQGYYDGTCCAPYVEGHGAATGCDVSDSLYTSEITQAFQRAYALNITSKCPISTARLESPIIRMEAAKMMSVFTIQILGLYPDTHKTGCDSFSDTKNLSDEMKFFTKTACQLNLMGLKSDGKTVDKTFDPHAYVNRAQFGTILSRLIYGDKYNIYTGEDMKFKRYEKHLNALNRDTIMKKIQDPFMLEERARVLLMLNRTVENKLVTKYRIIDPATIRFSLFTDSIR